MHSPHPSLCREVALTGIATSHARAAVLTAWPTVLSFWLGSLYAPVTAAAMYHPAKPATFHTLLVDAYGV